MPGTTRLPPERQWGERIMYLGVFRAHTLSGRKPTPFPVYTAGSTSPPPQQRGQTQNLEPVPSAITPVAQPYGSPSLFQAKATSMTMIEKREVSPAARYGRRNPSGGANGGQEGKSFLTPGLTDHPPLLP